MSLYNSIASQMASSAVNAGKNAAIGVARNAVNGAIGGVAAQANNAIREARGSINGAVTGALGSTAGGIVNAGINAGINQGLGMVSRAINSGLSGLSGGLLGGGSNLRVGSSGGSQSQICGASPVLGGVSMAEAYALHQEQLDAGYAQKNLWMLEVVSSPLAGSFDNTFNLYATAVEYTPLTISGDKIKVGAAVVDSVLSSEPVEMRVTTRDDKQGSVRKWFDAHAIASAHSDGTVGYPADYMIRIKVTQAFITSDSNRGGHEDYGLYRASNVDVSLSRSEDALSELNLTFVQLDTFMSP